MTLYLESRNGWYVKVGVRIFSASSPAVEFEVEEETVFLDPDEARKVAHFLILMAERCERENNNDDLLEYERKICQLAENEQAELKDKENKEG